MDNYPAYVHRMLNQARALIDEDDITGPEAAAICFDVLALFPDCQEAADLVLEAFNDPWLIRENRRALSRLIDEWDDRPWQQRRRLACSFNYTSCWEGQYREWDENVNPEEVCPSDVKAMLQEGEQQLIQDYLLGERRGAEAAWAIFQEAIKLTYHPRAAMLWVGDLYARQGYFAESVDVLEQLLAEFPKDAEARRLWAEARWWRDHQDQIPWIPPAGPGNGRRWRRIMQQTDPEFARHEADYLRPLPYTPPDKSRLPDNFALPPFVSPDLIARVEEALQNTPPPSTPNSPVDWSYLDKLETGDADIADFPAWAQYMLLEIDDPEERQYLIRFFLEHFSNPPIDDDAA